MTVCFRILGWICMALSFASLSPLVIAFIDMICWVLTGHAQIVTNWDAGRAWVAILLIVAAFLFFMAAVGCLSIADEDDPH